MGMVTVLKVIFEIVAKPRAAARGMPVIPGLLTLLLVSQGGLGTRGSNNTAHAPLFILFSGINNTYWDLLHLFN